jgi:hypothetical protein
MAVLLKQYDSEVYAELQDSVDEILEPMPFIIL